MKRWLGGALLVVAIAAGLLVWIRPGEGFLYPVARFPKAYPVHGVDLSHHNGEVDFGLLADAGIAFAYVKATEGGDWSDPRYRAYREAAERAGLRVGAYHFFTFCRPGLEQAAHFLSTAQLAKPALPPAVDVEFGGNCRERPGPERIRAELEAFVGEVERRTGRVVVLYVTEEARDELLGAFSRPLWYRSIAREPTLEWSFWQFDAAARLNGVNRTVDLNVFRGELAALDAL